MSRMKSEALRHNVIKLVSSLGKFFPKHVSPLLSMENFHYNSTTPQTVAGIPQFIDNGAKSDSFLMSNVPLS